MNEVWNLDPIYKGFDDPAFESDLNTVKELLTKFTAFTAALTDADIAETVSVAREAFAVIRDRCPDKRTFDAGERG